jgi:hypothetical protein
MGLTWDCIKGFLSSNRHPGRLVGKIDTGRHHSGANYRACEKRSPQAKLKCWLTLSETLIYMVVLGHTLPFSEKVFAYT